MKISTVVVGLSGGVDSSVAALLLKKAGYQVIGLFMKNWHDTKVTISDQCPWLEDSYDAMIVAEKLSIPFQTIDFSDEYKVRVVDYMFREYSKGRTPNPDIVCNRAIKFDLFLKAAQNIGADFIATGHYAKKNEIGDSNGIKQYKLIAGSDSTKDQSYFLCQLSQQQLSKVLFPIGHLKKTEVRQIAKANNLITAKKRDSQGLCFVGKVRLSEFLKQQLKPKTGDIIEIPSEHPMYSRVIPKQDLKGLADKFKYKSSDGELIGSHQGAFYYTIGQRKGLRVGGMENPLYVIDVDTDNNIVFVGKGKNHPGLYRKALLIKKCNIHWIRDEYNIIKGQSVELMARIRYRQPLVHAKLNLQDEGLYIIFNQPQSAITQGQFATWYQNDELLGSGEID